MSASDRRKAPNPGERPTLPLSGVGRIDRACDAFEAAWRAAPAAERPRIEQFLEDGPERAPLARELVALEVEYRRRAGEAPRVEDYLGRFPSLDREWLAALIATGEPPPAGPGAAPDPARVSTVPAGGDGPSGAGGAGRRLGKFLLLERVGEGAFGAVWRAHDTVLDRLVALKIPHAGLLASPAALQRFHREARAAAQLRHPGIVAVHEVTLLEDLPAVVSDFIEGITLKDFLKAGRPAFRESAEMVARLAEALDYAHELGVVHRDVKPGNIMLELAPAGAAAPSPARPRPLVADFGLALRGEADDTLTVEGQILGTPAYMSPEQAAGQGHRADGRSDIFSLGVVLYELLTGAIPFRGDSKAVTLHKVRHEEPRPPRRLDRSVPRDLETVCLKAIEKEPARRYARARDLADDLRRFLGGEPIRARPATPWERGWKWARRRPAEAALVGAGVLALLGLTGGSLIYAGQQKLIAQEQEQGRIAAEKAAQREKELKEAAEASELSATRYSYLSDLNLVQRAWEEGDVGLARTLLGRQRGREGKKDFRGIEWYYYQALCDGARHTFGHGGAVMSVAFSPDGKTVASGSDWLVKFWDVESSRELRTLHIPQANAVAFSPDGKTLAGGGADEVAWFWDPAGGKPCKFGGHTRGVSAVAVSPDGKTVASGGLHRGVRLWDRTTGRELRTLQGDNTRVNAVAFSPDGKTLAAATGDPLKPGEVRVWEVGTGKELCKCEGHTAGVQAIAFSSPDGKVLATASRDHTVKLWDAATGRELRTFEGHTGAVSAVAFSPDGLTLASGGYDRTVRLWDVESGWEVSAFKGHEDEVLSVAFSPDGQAVASGSRDQSVKVWRPADRPERLLLRGHKGVVWSVAFSADGKRLASAGADGIIRLWDVGAGRTVRTLGAPKGAVLSVAYSPDGEQLASASQDGTVRLWDRGADQPPRELKGHTGGVSAFAFSPDGKWLVSGGQDGTMRLWDAADDRPARALTAHAGGVSAVAFSPDGKWLASGGLDKTVRVWDLVTGQVLHTFTGHTDAVSSVAFAPDGKTLASAGGFDARRKKLAGEVKLWDPTAGREAGSLPDHPDRVTSLAYAPGGESLVTASSPGGVRLWDLTTRQVRAFFKGPPHQVQCVAFDRSGNRLAAGSLDGTARVWDATGDREAEPPGR